MEPALTYANVTGRPTSTFVRLAARLSRGVAAVQRQHAPYAAAWHQANLAALREPGPRWIVLGDSMSQGIGTAAFDAGWVNQLQGLLRIDGVELPIVNLSASGARVPDVLTQQIPAWRGLPVAPGPSTAPDLVTVLIGSNDLLSKAYREQVADNVADLLHRLPRGAVIATMPQPRAAAYAVNALLRQAADRGDVTLVDMRSSAPASWRGRLASDHFHPNELGYSGIAAAFHDPVLRALGATAVDETPS